MTMMMMMKTNDDGRIEWNTDTPMVSSTRNRYSNMHMHMQMLLVVARCHDSSSLDVVAVAVI
jgi:hypothetical protein